MLGLTGYNGILGYRTAPFREAQKEINMRPAMGFSIRPRK